MSKLTIESVTKSHHKAKEVKKTVVIIVPVFNEQAAINKFAEVIDNALAGLADRIQFELLFVNDGSSDGTETRIEELIAKRSNITLVNLSRNFGKEAALSAGIYHAEADAIIPIDVDLQDPPTVIPKMIDCWEAGAKVVNARRKERQNDTWIKKTSAKIFYRVFNMLADYPIPNNVGDFRLLDREVVTVLRELGERSRFNKALFSWVGFETKEICYERPARESGSSSWSYWKLWKLALDGIFSSSTIPLRIWTYLGILLAFASFIYSMFILLLTLLFGADTPGYASTVILILMFGGLNMFALGILGEYVGRIYTEVRKRPLYIVRSVKTGGIENDNGS